MTSRCVLSSCDVLRGVAACLDVRGLARFVAAAAVFNVAARASRGAHLTCTLKDVFRHVDVSRGTVASQVAHMRMHYSPMLFGCALRAMLLHNVTTAMPSLRSLELGHPRCGEPLQLNLQPLLRLQRLHTLIVRAQLTHVREHARVLCALGALKTVDIEGAGEDVERALFAAPRDWTTFCVRAPLATQTLRGAAAALPCLTHLAVAPIASRDFTMGVCAFATFAHALTLLAFSPVRADSTFNPCALMDFVREHLQCFVRLTRLCIDGDDEDVGVSTRAPDEALAEALSCLRSLRECVLQNTTVRDLSFAARLPASVTRLQLSGTHALATAENIVCLAQATRLCALELYSAFRRPLAQSELLPFLAPVRTRVLPRLRDFVCVS